MSSYRVVYSLTYSLIMTICFVASGAGVWKLRFLMCKPVEAEHKVNAEEQRRILKGSLLVLSAVILLLKGESIALFVEKMFMG